MRFAILAAALLAASPLTAQEVPELPGWMAGAWEQTGGEGRWADEYWTPPRGGIMLGAARIGKGAGLSIFEHSRIVRNADGTLSFFAQPLGRPAAEFPMVTQDGGMIEFANPAHDYPQRVKYWREGDRLKARVSLFDGSNPQDWDYAPMGAE